MARLTENQAISRAITEDIWKVHIHESERGWLSDSWYVFFDSHQEAHNYYMQVNKDNPDNHVPDYYVSASTPEKVVLTIK
jgi:hypothetical protein